MSTPFNFTTPKDIIKRPQYVTEGDIIATPANYGSQPADPTMTEAGKNAYLRINSTPDGIQTRQSGDEDINDSILIKKNFDAVLITNIVDSTLLQWAINSLGTGVGSIDSKTFIQSKYLSGTESFDILNGCLPQQCVLRIPRDGLIEMEIGMSVKDITNNSSFSIGSGAYGSALAGTPWKSDDGGTNPFVVNSVNTLERGITITVARVLGEIDSSGDLAAIYRKPTARNISIDAEIFKAGVVHQDGARAFTKWAASRVLKSAVSTITFTNLQWQSDSEEINPANTNTLTEPKSGIATAVVVT